METLEIRGDAPLSPYTGIGGWETEAEQGLLIMVASALQKRLNAVQKDKARRLIMREPIIVEIGSENGMSASLFRTFAPSATLFCIDINENANFVHNLKVKGLDDNLVPIFGNSGAMDWGHMMASSDIDLLFIDGDHSYHGALADLRNFAPYVIKDGWMLLHDTACPTNKLPHTQHKDVSRAIDTFMQEQGKSLGFKFLFSVDSISVFRRFS